jgi:HlyD family secretion protein
LKIRIKRRTVWVLVAVLTIAALVLAGGFLSWQRARADADPELDQVAAAFVGTLSSEASASGELLPRQEAMLSLATPGRVDQVLVQVGDHVRAGDVLLQLESDALERAVRTAKQSLVIQQANLADLLDGASPEDVAAARAAVASAQAQLDELLAGPDAVDLAAAEAAVASAQAQLDELLAGPDADDLAQARASLDSAQATARVEAERYSALEAQILVARQQLDVAEVALENARYFYDALKNDWQHKDYADFSPEAETLKDAQKAYNVALARYNLTAANMNDSTYRAAQAQVAQAQAVLSALTEEKSVQVASAREQLAQAEASFAALTEEKTTQIASARNQLAQAEASLEDLVMGISEEKLAVAEAQVAQARLALENAEARLLDATLVAPFDGVITALNVAVGEWATGPAAELVNDGSLEVILEVDEVDIGGIAVGQPTVVTLEAWPNQELAGEVTAIAPKGNTQSEIVTYEVYITIDAGDLPVLTGMTANARLITAQRENVLLVPNRAITADRQQNKYYVHQVQGDSVAEVEVTIGLRDSRYTEITGGLAEGAKVAIGYEADSGLPFGPGSGSRGMR